MKGKSEIREPQMKNKASWNQAMRQKSHKRIKNRVSSPCKIHTTISKMKTRRTQTNGLNEKEVDDYAKGLTSERWHRLYVGYHLPFQHNEPFHLPYMAMAEISLGISLRVTPEEPFLLLKYIITLSLILCPYY